MCSMAVIVMLKIDELRLQIGCGPEYDAVEILAANRADKSLYEGVRKRHVRNRLDFGYLEDPKISLPLVESIQRIVIRAEIFGQTVPANRAMEHLAQGPSIHDATVNAKTNDATRKLVHHHKNPVGSQCCRFASE